mmetsp:Transcript_37557/g.60573  ORF Transcript_37557/g.60573 Transcript_37557/m.60573 type:complete len:232 (-) Transcript_37557:83-778(-)
MQWGAGRARRWKILSRHQTHGDNSRVASSPTNHRSLSSKASREVCWQTWTHETRQKKTKRTRFKTTILGRTAAERVHSCVSSRILSSTQSQVNANASDVAVHCKAPTFFWHLDFFGVFPRFWPIFFEILFLQRLPCVFQRPKQFETLQKYFWGTPHGDSTHLYALISRFFKKNMGFVVKKGMILNTARIWKQGLKRTVEPPKTQQCKNLPTGIPNIELRAAAAGLKRGDGR